MSDFQEKIKAYMDINKEIAELRKSQGERKKLLQSLESEIKEYMEKNEMDSISTKDGEIVLYDRKVNQSFKKETMVDKLTEQLKGDDKKAEKLVDSIISNKVFTVQKTLKANLKKK